MYCHKGNLQVMVATDISFQKFSDFPPIKIKSPWPKIHKKVRIIQEWSSLKAILSIFQSFFFNERHPWQKCETLQFSLPFINIYISLFTYSTQICEKYYISLILYNTFSKRVCWVWTSCVASLIVLSASLQGNIHRLKRWNILSQISSKHNDDDDHHHHQYI